MTIKENYQHVLNDISEIAKACGRSPEDILLLAVTKTQPLSAIQEVYLAGCRDFGENRVQEVLPKMEELHVQARWHLIGTLQKNKVSKVIGKFYMIHSVDSPELAEKIAEASVKSGIVTRILLEVNTSGEESKHGFTPDGFKESVQAIAELPNIELHGLMTMAPFDASEDVIRHCFSKLRKLKEETVLGARHPFNELSMGMTHDYRIAIEEGATIVRIGTALFEGSSGLSV